MKLILQILAVQLATLAAPFVTLFYRKGIWLTPDDPVSPFGCGTTPGASTEPFMQKLYAKAGKFVGDWWWLGMRNAAYGLSYKFKPQHFKDLKTYKHCECFMRWDRWGPFNVREIEVDGYLERTFFFKFFHVIVGYRLRPVYDEWRRGLYFDDPIPTREINMDARTILSIRWGNKDD